MPKESNLELKVGTFVILALTCLTIFVFSVSDNTIFQKGISFKILFKFANGVKKSAPVRMAGVEQGIVQNLKVLFDEQDQQTKVTIEVKVRKDTRIPIDSTVMINQLGLLGEKYVEIIPGTNRERFVVDGDILVGKDPIAQEFIAERVISVANKIDKSIEGINAVVLNNENQKSLAMTLENLKVASDELNRIFHTIQTGQGTIGRLIYDESVYENIEGLTAELKTNPWKLLYRPKEKGKGL